MKIYNPFYLNIKTLSKVFSDNVIESYRIIADKYVTLNPDIFLVTSK